MRSTSGSSLNQLAQGLALHLLVAMAQLRPCGHTTTAQELDAGLNRSATLSASSGFRRRLVPLKTLMTLSPQSKTTML
jgi:hypothetical protein